MPTALANEEATILARLTVLELGPARTRADATSATHY